MLKAALQEIISTGYSEGQLQYGDLGLGANEYANRIILIVQKHVGDTPQLDSATNFAGKLHVRDLYLAIACAQRSPGSSAENPKDRDYTALAWKTLESTYKSFVCDLVRFFSRASFAVEDLADNIFTDLYLPDRSGFSRIASYDGRSSLSTWLRVVICNRVINVQRSIAYSKSTDMETELPDEPALRTIESVLRAHRYESALRDSIQEACRGLTPRERLMILWRYQDGLQLGQIARLLGIHQSNVTRQLTRLQSKLRDQVISALTTTHGLSAQAIQECLEDVVENPLHEISILEFVQNLEHSTEKKTAASYSGEVLKADKKPG